MLDGSWLFPGANPMKPLNIRQFNRSIHVAAESARIGKQVSVHTARRNFATHFGEQKMDNRRIQVQFEH
jgi:site-specific recombinase XerD